ncbi:MAG: YwmB family TATA-box binding protein [Caulobacteraceae bacterium]
MKKRVLLLLFCVLFITGDSEAAAAPSAVLSEEEALMTSFESTKAEVLESTISCWTKLNDEFLSIKQVEAEMDRVIGLINPDKETVVKNVENNEQLNKIVLYGSKGNKSYNVAVESAKKDKAGETYIVIDVSMDKNCTDLKAEKDFITTIIPVDESYINYSSCIIGTYKGKLNEREVEKAAHMALQSINAEKVEGIDNDDMKSISAFSSSVGGYILSDRKRINLQVAIRYSPYDNKTYIWIGTPLIPMEY